MILDFCPICQLPIQCQHWWNVENDDNDNESKEQESLEE